MKTKKLGCWLGLVSTPTPPPYYVLKEYPDGWWLYKGTVPVFGPNTYANCVAVMQVQILFDTEW